MMLRRRMPSATPSSTHTPSSSGPRWRMTSHISVHERAARRPARTATRLADDSTKPAMPHMGNHLHASRFWCTCRRAAFYRHRTFLAADDERRTEERARDPRLGAKIEMEIGNTTAAARAETRGGPTFARASRRRARGGNAAASPTRQKSMRASVSNSAIRHVGGRRMSSVGSAMTSQSVDD